MGSFEVLENFGENLREFWKILENFGENLGEFWKILENFVIFGELRDFIFYNIHVFFRVFDHFVEIC